MIPALDTRGLLPEGIHEATLADMESVFAFNAIRKQRIHELRRFISGELNPLANGLEFYLCGSYLSDKASPGDIDCTLKIPAHDVSNRLVLIDIFRDGRSKIDKGRIWDTYRVDAFLTISLPGFNDFSDFFQYVGEKTASLKGINEKDKRGIIKVESWIHG